MAKFGEERKGLHGRGHPYRSQICHVVLNGFGFGFYWGGGMGSSLNRSKSWTCCVCCRGFSHWKKWVAVLAGGSSWRVCLDCKIEMESHTVAVWKSVGGTHAADCQNLFAADLYRSGRD